MSDKNTCQEWHPYSDTQVVGEQTIISPISLKLCCIEIAEIMSRPQLKQDRGELISSRLDELLKSNVGAITPSALTHLGKENKAFQNTQNRLKLATIIANEVRLHLDKKLAGEAKEIAFKSIDSWLNKVTARRQESQPEPSTERAKKAFAKAVEAGMMEKTATGYKWLYQNGSKASLSYFLVQVYNPDGSQVTPFLALENVLNVTRLDSASDKAISGVKTPQKWRGKIDELLKEL